jgi:ComF family protein
MEHLAAVARQWTGAAVDLLFPPRCPACGEIAGADRRHPLCRPCWRAVIRLRPPWCAICGRPFWTFDAGSAAGRRPAPAAATCAACRVRRPPFAWARSAALYAGVVRDAVRALKFSGAMAIARPLGDLVLEVCAGDLPVSVEVVVPVPLHRARKRERGYNQAALLAARVAGGLGAELNERALTRTRATLAQTDLSAAERPANVRGAFAVDDTTALAGRHAALVDDVLTTGATVAECARVVLDAGAESVGVLTVARVA